MDAEDGAGFAQGKRYRWILQQIENSEILKQSFQLEPRLYAVLAEVSSYISVKDQEVAYVVLKERCRSLVGFSADKPGLRPDLYYITFVRLLEQLVDWVVDHSKVPPEDVDLFADNSEDADIDEEEEINAAVRKSMAESREASLEVFRPLTGEGKEG